MLARRFIVFATLALLSWSVPAVAQSRFALEVDVGAQLALSPSIHRVVSLDVEAADGATATGTPRLSDRLNSPGLHIGVTALVSTLEVRYRLESYGWRGARTRCVGDREAQLLPNGEVADAEVRYRCSDDGERIDFDVDTSSALVFHHLSVGPRFYLDRRPRAVTRGGATFERPRTQLYAVPFGGFTLAQYVDPNLGRQLRGGLHLGAGAGAEIPLERRFSFVVDLRYTLSLVGGAAAPSARARRAIADQRSTFAALLDSFHRVGVNVGLRFDFR